MLRFKSVGLGLWLLVVAFFAQPGVTSPPKKPGAQQWLGTWAAAPQAAIPGGVPTFENQTLRLIVHTSAGGSRVRIKVSNVFGDQPLMIGAAHIALRTSAADIDPPSDRTLTFQGQRSTTIAAGSMRVSDPVELDVPALSDVAISFFFPQSTAATTWHILAKQTNYINAASGDATGTAKFAIGSTIPFWPFLTGVDVTASMRQHSGACNHMCRGTSIVAFGASLTDGDGSTSDVNRRWPDVLAERLQKAPEGNRDLGVLNEGIIGNRLLSDFHSPRQQGGPFESVFNQLGPAIGDAGLARFERDVLDQANVRYVILALGVNDILFPGSFIPATTSVSAQDVIAGNRQLIARAHKKGIRVIGTTIPPFENATFRQPVISFFTPEKEKARQEVNAWIRTSGEFDGIIDFDEAVRDPNHPAQLRPDYDSGDHLHVNDAGNVAQGNAIPLSLFRER